MQGCDGGRQNIHIFSTLTSKSIGRFKTAGHMVVRVPASLCTADTFEMSDVEALLVDGTTHVLADITTDVPIPGKAAFFGCCLGTLRDNIRKGKDEGGRQHGAGAG